MDHSIADAARLTGLAASTIRYYEELGLMPAATRAQNGRRIFDPSAIAQLSLLNDLRLAGMTLADIKEFQNQRRKAGATCEGLVKIAEDRASSLRQQIKAMRLAEARLRNFALACNGACSSSSASGCDQIGLMSLAI